MANIRIDIASEFKDRGFKKAEKATNNLNTQLKSLGRTLGLALSTREIVQFGRASVKAFSDDQQAAARLTQTLGNLGLAFEQTNVTKFIAELEATSGVLDDSLRPAMQSLLLTTGSVAKSQELLNLALEMSRASGMDVADVSRDLAKAYVGQTRGLTKYNIGLTQAEIKTKTFAELQAILTKQFTGQNAAYLETYAGKVGVLNVAFANMQETIGEGLVDAFMLLAGDKGIGGGVTAMEIFAEKVANTSRGIGVLISSFSSLRSYAKTVFDVFRNMDPFAPLTAITELGKKNKPLFFPTGGLGSKAEQTARAKAEKDAARRAKQLADLQKKSAAATAKAEAERAKREREALALKRAGTIFDMENIQVVAAMQGKVDGEQRLRLTALLALQTANAEAAEKLATAVLNLNAPAFANLGVIIKTGDSIDTVIGKIINSQTRLALLTLGIKDIPKAKNPFEDWDTILDRLLDKVKNLKNAVSSIGGGTSTQAGGAAGGGNGGGGGGSNTTITANPTDPTGVSIAIPGGQTANPFETFNVGSATIIANSGVVQSAQAGDTPVETAARQRIADIFASIGTFGAGGFNPTNVTVNVAGTVVSNTDLIAAVTEGLYEVQRRGQSITLSAVAI
jgi:hypothetical protein